MIAVAANCLNRLVRRSHLSSIAMIGLATLAATGAAEARSHHHAGHAHHRYASVHAHVIQCVAFAKEASDVELRGNARDWWSRAAGVYERGHAPEEGSVLNFRPTGRMPLGHVAVVTQVVDSRTIQIDQSHWNSRGISRDVSVVDVSPNNDWSAVRVELGHQGTYGSIYPTFGFIYPRAAGPDDDSSDSAPRVIEATATQRAHRHRPITEVAEMPATMRGIDTTVPLSLDDAPNRNLR
ncbi:surface antigen [Endobacter medicaginis]|uniref:CHAP domain-containing protein n=2 Tax=Endobacter medicaginis TaxID=1181271 RepID=A0A850NSS6_9PROT|nr:CHAP domain-containing protein [Endobacter medicaginis]MBB3175102.1 surface antigen [Endobacter medicaginis]MCX5476417.1 CHAP domain-containing protein [Endobacter medicaginis]NVN30395.1 CHAP domain-containing protein [Endobacter medicaginis]